ncbi:hypothetical protein FCM35_KLT15575 [Carex littledalei]|uniref:Peptide transporter n=1 Tax=Carex littledalei TaxID=544730 RepID=A0A833REH0_9POAL|nr:hypothetical protein FCM35_KLT15575 [Carex littledalei]
MPLTGPHPSPLFVSSSPLFVSSLRLLSSSLLFLSSLRLPTRYQDRFMVAMAQESLLIEEVAHEEFRKEYTGDGSVNIKGLPILKHETGNWKAYYFILVYIQDNYGWGLGFGIPTLFMGVAIVSFFIGSGVYRFQKTGGSPITRVCQVIVAACRKCTAKLPVDASLLYEVPGNNSAIKGSKKLDHTSELRYLDKAAIVTPSDIKFIRGTTTTPNPWSLCTVGSFTIPPASLSTFHVISLLNWIPIYDKILVPVVSQFTAAVVEIKRLETAQELNLIHEKIEIPMSILWQILQYSLVGASEVFNHIGQIEFFYDQSPDAMKSLCTALGLLTSSLGSYLSSFILLLVSYYTTRGGEPGWIPDNLNEGHLDRVFWLIAGLRVLNLVVFVWDASTDFDNSDEQQGKNYFL